MKNIKFSHLPIYIFFNYRKIFLNIYLPHTIKTKKKYKNIELENLIFGILTLLLITILNFLNRYSRKLLKPTKNGISLK